MWLSGARAERVKQDHLQIDRVLLDRVSAEDDELAAQGPRSLLDRVLAPLNRIGTKRFLTEARRKVWHNTLELDRARQRSDSAYRDRLAQLELVSAARVRDLFSKAKQAAPITVGSSRFIPSSELFTTKTASNGLTMSGNISFVINGSQATINVQTITNSRSSALRVRARGG